MLLDMALVSRNCTGMTLQLDNTTVIPLLLAHLSQFGLNGSHVHELHVAHLELHVHRGRRFAGGPASGAPRRGRAAGRSPGALARRRRRTRLRRVCCRRASLQAGVRRCRFGVWREERLRPARRQVAAVRQPVGAGVAVLRARARRLPAQGVGVFIAGEVRDGVLQGGDTVWYGRCHGSLPLCLRGLMRRAASICSVRWLGGGSWSTCPVPIFLWVEWVEGRATGLRRDRATLHLAPEDAVMPQPATVAPAGPFMPPQT